MIDPAVLETVSVPLALEDAVPVLLSTAGMIVLARAVGRRMDARLGGIAFAGALLIGCGGLAKVTWKVAAAGFERDLTGVDDLLFPFLAVGFVLLTTSVVATRRGLEPSRQRANMLLMAGFSVAVMVMSFSFVSADLGRMVAMVVAIVGSLTLSWQLIAIARSNGDGRALTFLVVNVVATLGLAGMARIEVQTLGLQWIEQSINTVSQGLFLVAAVRLAKDATTWVPDGVDERVDPALVA